jgi:hypothetical protein
MKFETGNSKLGNAYTFFVFPNFKIINKGGEIAFIKPGKVDDRHLQYELYN